MIENRVIVIIDEDEKENGNGNGKESGIVPQDLDKDEKDDNNHYKGEDDKQQSAVVFLRQLIISEHKQGITYPLIINH